MWSTVEKLYLPLGDSYLIQTQNKLYRGIVKDKYNDMRIQCTSTPSKFTVKQYYDIVCLVQREMLSGNNPYVSKKYANEYLKLIPYR